MPQKNTKVAKPAKITAIVKPKTAISPVAQDLLQWSVPRLIGAGYGLFSRKAADPRWPEFFITAFVLRKYRQRNSFWFMIRHAARGMRKHEIVAGEAKALLAKLIGSKPRQLYQLSGIYRAVRDEKGPAVATAVTVEIIRISNQKRAGRLTWWKPGQTKTFKAIAPTQKKAAMTNEHKHATQTKAKHPRNLRS